MAESVLLSSIDTYDIDNPSLKVATDNVYAEGSSIRCERIEYRDTTDTTQTSDKVVNVTFNNSGVFSSGNDFFGNEFSYVPFELDDLGRPIANFTEDELVLGSKVKAYGDGSTYAQPDLFQTSDGFIRVGGLLAVVNSADPVVNGTLLATLPAQFAPNQQRCFVVMTDAGFARVDVKQDGSIVAVLPTGASVTKYISLENIQFPAPQ
jgi:hypothetical protein